MPQEVTHTLNLNALEVAMPEEVVLVSGHDDLRAGGLGALEDAIIRRIFLDQVDAFGGFDMPGDPSHDPSGLLEPILRPFEPFPQGSRDLLNNMTGIASSIFRSTASVRS
jgi:hypothetical protein